MFPTAHCGLPGSYVNFTSAGFGKEPFSGNDKGTAGRGGFIRIACRTLVC